eukprot:3227495-Karenia_brevis.AAC.1
MSDAAEEYRETARKVFSQEKEACENLMCWYHMKAAVGEYAKKHCLCEAKDEFVKAVEEDCDRMHHSSNMAEFQAKATAIRQHWLDD